MIYKSQLSIHRIQIVTELTSGIGFDDKNIPGADNTMKACRTLVGHFCHSSQAARKLKEKQADSLCPLTVVSTRWWSTYTMTERFLVLKVYFDLMEREGSPQCNLTEAQWGITSLVRDVSKPFM